MKLRNIFLSILACLAFVSCNEKIVIPTLSELELSTTFVAIEKDGGTTSVGLSATESWYIDQTQIPDWLTVTPTEGGAGDYTLQFSAEATTKTRKVADLRINVAAITGDGASAKVQYINVEQSIGIPVVSNATCAEVIAGADGKTYRVKGAVTSIANTQYGNWYLKDDTGEIYIYGTLDNNGAEKNFLSLGIEVGDIVTVEGPKTTYGSVIELVNVTVVNIEKSLISAVDKEVKASKEGGIVDVKLICKSGNGVNFSIPAEDQSWVTIPAITPLGDTTVVSLNVAANLGGDRKTTLEFTTTSGGKVYSAQVALAQEGAIIDATVAEFLAAEEGETQYRVTGVIKSIKLSPNYHNADITILGGLGEEVLLYRAVSKDVNIEDLDLHEGDMVTFVGKRSSYKGTPQMAAGGVFESVVCYTKVSVAEFLAAEESSTLYSVTGVIEKVSDLSAQYNNVSITIKDGENSVLCYRTTTFDKSGVDKLDLTIGNKITIAGKRSSYKGTPQMAAGCIVLSIEPNE